MIHVLRYTEELEKVGFTNEQAKKSVQLWMDLMDQNFATKSDFKEYYLMTKNDMKDLEHRLTVRLGVMLASSIGIISALITLKH